jgi:hypothetical protein
MSLLGWMIVFHAVCWGASLVIARRDIRRGRLASLNSHLLR